jgi:hypothetical protein
MLPSVLAGKDSPTNQIVPTQTEKEDGHLKMRQRLANSKYKNTQ